MFSYISFLSDDNTGILHSEGIAEGMETNKKLDAIIHEANKEWTERNITLKLIKETIPGLQEKFAILQKGMWSIYIINCSSQSSVQKLCKIVYFE